MHNFVNFHVLISHSPSCLNRDDMNMQKYAMFGGVRRVRISSQSLKRAIRRSEEYKRRLGECSVRTRSLDKLKIEFGELLQDEFDSETIAQAIDLFVKSKKSDDESNEEEETREDEEVDSLKKKIAVAPWVIGEIRVIAAAVKEVSNSGFTDAETAKIKEKLSKQKGKKKKSEEELKQELLLAKVQKATTARTEELKSALASAVDIALSGRMATSGLMTSIDGALAVAHVITTHAVDSDIDWFTAVDDLVSEAGETGAGHLNTQEFSSGTFYRYASLNLAQLQENLGGATRERALEIAGHLAFLFATIVPEAKQQTFAAHNPADTVLVSFSDLPVSLANAFEAPVTTERNSGFRKPSQSRLFEYWQQVHSGYGLDENPAAYLLDGTKVPEGVHQKGSLAALVEWIGRDGRD